MTFRLSHRCVHGDDGGWHDSARERVLKWETVNVISPLPPGDLSPVQCREFIRKVAHHLGVKVPDVKFEPGETCYADRNGAMTVSDTGCTQQAILHEMAHIATLEYTLAGDPPHDYRFVATVTDLYATFLGLDAKQLTVAGKRRGISNEERVKPAKWEERPLFAGEF